MKHTPVLLARRGTGFAVVIALLVTSCGWRPENLFGTSSTTSVSIAIQDASASRDPVTLLPVITVSYSIKFPYQLFAQYTTAPTITCTMTQVQKTTTRTFSSQPVSITNASQIDQLTINVPEEGRAIGGAFDVSCVVSSDHPLNTSNTVSVDVPGPPASGVALDTSGDWTFTWTWNVTIVSFVGPVTGGPSTWKFTGNVKSGGNALWTPKVDSAQASCTVTGTPPNSTDSSKTTQATLNCSANFPEGAWEGNTTGTLELNSISNGKYTFHYVGSGDGHGSDGKNAHIDNFDLKSNAQ